MGWKNTDLVEDLMHLILMLGKSPRRRAVEVSALGKVMMLWCSYKVDVLFLFKEKMFHSMALRFSTQDFFFDTTVNVKRTTWGKPQEHILSYSQSGVPDWRTDLLCLFWSEGEILAPGYSCSRHTDNTQSQDLLVVRLLTTKPLNHVLKGCM